MHTNALLLSGNSPTATVESLVTGNSIGGTFTLTLGDESTRAISARATEDQFLEGLVELRSVEKVIVARTQTAEQQAVGAYTWTITFDPFLPSTPGEFGYKQVAGKVNSAFTLNTGNLDALVADGAELDASTPGEDAAVVTRTTRDGTPPLVRASDPHDIAAPR